MDYTGFRTVERVVWSRERLGKQWIQPLVDGILYGVAGGLVAGIKVGVLNGFWHGAVFGLISGVVGCLLVGLSVGYDPALSLTRNRPDIGIWRSGKNAFWFGCTAFLVGLLVGGEVGYAAAGKPGALALGLGSAVALAVGVGARMGGGAWDVYWMNIYHLCKATLGPWKYAQFLEQMTERLFLIRIGRPYEFIHAQLRDHFAAKYINTGGFVESGMIRERRRSRFRTYQATGIYSRFDDTAWRIWELSEEIACLSCRPPPHPAIPRP